MIFRNVVFRQCDCGNDKLIIYESDYEEWNVDCDKCGWSCTARHIEDLAIRWNTKYADSCANKFP